MSNQLRMIMWKAKFGNAISLHLLNGKLTMSDAESSFDYSPMQTL